ncbi:MAG: aminotransferase class I/II-fold pyridoxal phosphate-dependent enzyme, partial [Mycobacteriales bacterium]
MTDPLCWLADHEAAREAAGLRRRLRPRAPSEPLIDLASNDYLGLARHPQVIEAGAAALRTWGAGSTSSRLVVGTTELHVAFERALAEFIGAPAALVFSSGYLANLGAVTSLTGDGDLIVSDAHCHASLVDACRLSRARVVVVPHCDVAAVEAALGAGSWRRALVITDSVFSADGDLAPLSELHDVVRRHGAVLFVDDAHALGVVG